MEPNIEILKLVKQSPKILPLIYTDLAQPGVRKIGIALETVFEFSTSMLLPIKLLNEKFKLNFERNLNDYKKKLEAIPEDKICDVNPQIGTPIIEKLTYTTNEEIADLFTSLLTKASNTDTVNQAHPSFVQLIERLSVDEARIIKILKEKDNIPTITIRAHIKGKKSFITIHENATMLQFQTNLIFPNNINIYLDNLYCLGILSIDQSIELTDDKIYEQLLSQYDFETLSKTFTEGYGFERLECKKSYYKITNYGKLFINAV